MKEKWSEMARRCAAKMGTYRYAVLVILLGVALLLLPTEGDPGGLEEQAHGVQAEAFDLPEFERRLEQVLSKVEGAGEAHVMLTLDQGSRQVLAQDVDRDSEGGGSSTTVTLGKGSGNQDVVPLQTLAPSFRGALVVCPGGNDPKVKLKLSEAVSALTGLGSDCISICEGST